jgi:nucleoid DNA-binding protein
VPAKRIPYFKPSNELKDLVNEDGRNPDAIIPDGTPM